MLNLFQLYQCLIEIYSIYSSNIGGTVPYETSGKIIGVPDLQLLVEIYAYAHHQYFRIIGNNFISRRDYSEMDGPLSDNRADLDSRKYSPVRTGQ